MPKTKLDFTKHYGKVEIFKSISEDNKGTRDIAKLWTVIGWIPFYYMFRAM